jgi:hypothetical protein
MKRVAYLTCGEYVPLSHLSAHPSQRFALIASPSLQSLASVEGLLLLAEWPPLSHLLSDPSSQERIKARSDNLLESSRIYDHFTWSMIGMVSFQLQFSRAG